MAKQVKHENLAARRSKELAILKAQNELLESAKDTVMEHYKDTPDRAAEYIKEIDIAQKENIEKGYNLYGAKTSDIESATYGEADAAGIAEYKEHLRKRGITDESQLYKKDMTESTTNVELTYGTKKTDSDDEFHLEKIEMPEIEEGDVSIGSEYSFTQAEIKPVNKQQAIPSNVQFDMLPLPSNGECYPHKQDRVTVGYLTASDENAITSPNLYRDGKVLDVILKRKILDENINPDELVSGDRDMILLWLRATGYGVNFPIKVRDPQSGTIFESSVDLSKIKTKEFTLKGDENGWFDYKASNGDTIKFKYLTHKEDIALVKNNKLTAKQYEKAKLIDLVSDLTDELDSDEILSEENKGKIEKAIGILREWIDAIKLDDNLSDAIDETLTEKMIAETMSVNGNTDREFIREYINGMRALDARNYRIYVQNNEPGMDFSITVNRPESLGGGSFDTFLNLDSLLFLGVS